MIKKKTLIIFYFKCAKMAKYARAQKICDTLFAIFALIWFLTRLCYYPYKSVYDFLH